MSYKVFIVLIYNWLTQDLRLGQKSDQGIRLLDGSWINALNLAKEYVISLPAM